LDVGLVCQFAVVHDLVEVYAGDTPNFATEKLRAAKDAREREALDKLKREFADLPWIIDTIVAYEEQSVPEAHFVRSLDKTLSLMQEHASDGQIFKDYKITQDTFLPALMQHRKKAMVHEGVFEYYEAAERAVLASPQLFCKDKI
jgi:5'-deoxynucleotidase YfbR-like HD superfamily hydrolase